MHSPQVIMPGRMHQRKKQRIFCQSVGIKDGSIYGRMRPGYGMCSSASGSYMPAECVQTEWNMLCRQDTGQTEQEYAVPAEGRTD